MTSAPSASGEGTESSATADPSSTDDASRAADLSPTELAQELLVATKRGDDPSPYERALAALDDDALRPVREDRATALSFWINCYNAGTQLLLDCRPDRYESPLRIVRFFATTAVTVGGTGLPLDRIENGLLRGRRSKYGLGYVPKLYVTGFERRYALEGCDPRIHFALNCGAESCPAIRAYDPAEIDEQLDLATRTYLDATVEHDPEADVVRVPRVFLWFYGDFGGRSGTRTFLREYDVIPGDASPSLRYQSWDWSKRAGKFVD
jgi:hypothetical protein